MGPGAEPLKSAVHVHVHVCACVCFVYCHYMCRTWALEHHLKMQVCAWHARKCARRSLYAHVQFPMYVLPTSKLQVMTKMMSFEELMADGSILEWTKGMGKVAFSCSVSGL